jgi:hypothetical protein
MAVDQGIYMAKRSLEKPQLARLTEIALKLPETTRKTHGSHAPFLVRKKIFAYFLNNHHGDGIVAITSKVLPGDNKALAEAQPRRFYLPAYIGSRGWVALRLDVGKVDWSEGTSKGKLCFACAQEISGAGEIPRLNSGHAN